MIPLKVQKYLFVFLIYHNPNSFQKQDGPDFIESRDFGVNQDIIYDGSSGYPNFTLYGTNWISFKGFNKDDSY